MGEDSIEKRFYIGGLYEGVTASDLKKRFEKFGKIGDVDLREKKDAEGIVFKRFAYVNIDSDEKQIKKFMNTYNKTKWNGQELQIQEAKASHLTKYQEERASASAPSAATEETTLKPVRDVMKGAKPGTAVPDKKNWVVGKYGQVMPLVYIRKKDKSKVMKYDPSKYTHAYKKLDNDKLPDTVAEKSVDELTWNLDFEETEISRKRMGVFPEYTPPKKKKLQSKKTRDANRPGGDGAVSSEEEEGFEVVKVQESKVVKPAPHYSETEDSGTDTIFSKMKRPKLTPNSEKNAAEERVKMQARSDAGGDKPIKVAPARNLDLSRFNSSESEEETSKPTKIKAKPEKKPKAEPKTVAKSKAERKTPSKPVEERKTPSKPVEERKTPSKPVEERKTPSKPVEERKTPSKPVEERKTPSKPVEERKTPSKTVEERKTPSKPVEERKTPSKPVEERKTPSKPVEERKTPSKTVEERKTPTKMKESKTPSKPISETEKITPMQVSSDDEEEEDFFDMIESGKINQFLTQTQTSSSPMCAVPKATPVRNIDLSKFDSDSEAEEVSKPAKIGSKTTETKSIAKSKAETKTSSKAKDTKTPKQAKEETPSKTKETLSKTMEETNTPSTSEKKEKGKTEGTEDKKKLSKSEKKKLQQEQGAGDAKKEKRKKSEEQRMESFKQRQKEMRNQKSLLQKALATGASAANKKIVFASSDEEEEKTDASKEKKPTGLTLFDEEDDDDSEEKDEGDDFRIRPEKEGKKGQKLMDLQSQIKTSDPRFKLDERFLDSSSESEDEQEEKAPAEGSIEKEKEMAMNTLKSIVGEKAASSSKPKKFFRDMNEVRYNPDEDDAKKKKEAEAKKKEKKTEKKEEIPEVPKDEFFYKTENNLKEAFEGKSSSFSLLDMFGVASKEKPDDEFVPVNDEMSDGHMSEEEEEKETENGDSVQRVEATLEKQKPESHIVHENFCEDFVKELKEFLGQRREPAERKKWEEKRAEAVNSFRKHKKRALRTRRTGGYHGRHKNHKKAGHHQMALLNFMKS